MAKDTDPEKAWHAHARTLVRQVNTGWWWERFSPLLCAAAVGACGIILLARSSGSELSTAALAGGTAAAVAGLAAIAFALARPRFLTRDEALVHLESRLRLHNALTAAAHGVRPWPKVPDPLPRGLRWRAEWLVLPVLVAAGLVVAALYLPLAEDTDGGAIVHEPTSWQEMESMLQVLDEDEVVDPDALERFRERIEEMRDQPVEDWYSHSSMEASDHERARLENAVQQLSEDLHRSEASLALLEKHADNMSATAREKLADEFAQALKGLEAGDLPLDPELAKALKNLDLSQLKSLSPEQLAQLREQLKKGAQACKACMGEGGGEAAKAWAEMSEEEMLMLINGTPGTGKQGNLPGRGGIARGPGTAPITLSENESDLGTSNLEAVSNPDLTRAAPADIVGVTVGEHDPDQSPIGPTPGGAISAPGQGGDTVWKNALVPAEKAALKRYFE